VISESKRSRRDHHWPSIFSRAALAKKAERERHNREHSAVRQCRSHFGIGTGRLDRAWLREFLAISERIFGP
jgi:hypothetical protein